MRLAGEHWGRVSGRGFDMTHRLFGPCGLASIILVCLFLPGTGLAQEPPIPIKPPEAKEPPAPAAEPPGPVRRPDWEAACAPACGVPGYPWGWPGYSGRAGQNWSNGLSLYGPPVPVYGPVPGVLGNDDLVRQWKHGPGIGMPFGWFGVYAASPRPKPLTVSVWPVVESVPAAAPAATQPGGCLILSVKVPQPSAEVYVDGVKTAQTGTDRLFESPPLEAGQAFRYELTVRWVERGVTYERKKAVTGTPGEVVRVDFTAPDVV